MRPREAMLQATVAGATVGLLAQTLVMRLNPEVTPTLRTVLLGAPLWMSYGAVTVGLPTALLLVLAGRLRRVQTDDGAWPVQGLVVLAFVIGAALSQVNADIHPEFLSGTGHRTLRQDAVAWVVAALLAWAGGTVVRRLGRPPVLCVLYVLFVFAMPLSRLMGEPTPLGQPQTVAVDPLGVPARSTVVCGVEGLDSKVLLNYASGGRYPALHRLRDRGAWGPLTPFRPYLPRAHWTAVATGTLPRRNGVKSRWGWDLPLLFDQTLRLLPWTPQGSRLILPWGLAERVDPPPSTIPPLWQRIGASGVVTLTLDWPGLWQESAGVVEIQPAARPLHLEPNFIAALELALEPFPIRQREVLEAVAGDLERVASAREALRSGTPNLWLHLDSLGVVRRGLEPLHPLDTSEREVLNLVMELLDRQLGFLLEDCGEDAVVAIVSPYGLSPPDPLERIRRLLGRGGTWRTSAETCPEGLLMLFGDGVAAGRRFSGAALTDVAPTLCYLQGLPLARYMDGGVVSEALDPAFLASRPLRVVD